MSQRTYIQCPYPQVSPTSVVDMEVLKSFFLVFLNTSTQGRVVSLQTLDPTVTQKQSFEWTLRNSDGKR